MPAKPIANLARLNRIICHLLTWTPDMQTPGIDFFSEPNWPNQLPNETIKQQSLPQESQSKQIQAEGSLQNSMEDIYKTYFPESKQEKKVAQPAYLIKEQENERCDYIFYQSQSSDLKAYSNCQVKQEQKLFESNQLNFDQSFPLYEDESSENYLQKKRNPKYKILSKSTKIFLVNQTQYMSISQVARMYDVSVNNLCRWKKTCERKAGAGRKVSDKQLEDRLIEWINKQKQTNGGINLTRKVIQDTAREWSSNPVFKASKGWFQRFVTRNLQLELMQLFGIRLKCNKVKREEMIKLSSQLLACSTKEKRVSERLKVKKENLKKEVQIQQSIDQ